MKECEDAISRAEVLKCLEKYTNAIYRIEHLPSVYPKAKVGKWIDAESLDGALWHVCSECGETDFYATNYCSNCGAKMESEE